MTNSSKAPHTQRAGVVQRYAIGSAAVLAFTFVAVLTYAMIGCLKKPKRRVRKKRNQQNVGDISKDYVYPPCQGSSEKSPAHAKVTSESGPKVSSNSFLFRRPLMAAVSGGSIQFSRSQKRVLSDEEESDYNIPDPTQDFAAMKASVMARQASGLSMLGGNSNSSKLFRISGQGVHSAVQRSMESMPKMGGSPKKVIAGFTPMLQNQMVQNHTPPPSNGDGFIKNFGQFFDRINAQPESMVIHKVHHDGPGARTGNEFPITNKQPATSSKFIFGPAPENSPSKIFGGSSIEMTISSEKFIYTNSKKHATLSPVALTNEKSVRQTVSPKTSNRQQAPSMPKLNEEKRRKVRKKKRKSGIPT